MNPLRVIASSLLVAAAFGVAPARADDAAARARVHVTADGPWLSLAQETPRGRVVVCARMPCDVDLDPNGVYRFVGVRRGIRDSQPIVLQAGSRVGVAVLAAGIVAVVFGYEMDQQAASPGQILEWGRDGTLGRRRSRAEPPRLRHGDAVGLAVAAAIAAAAARGVRDPARGGALLSVGGRARG